MGLFDMFKGDSDEMTPHLAFATSLIYMMASDGQIEHEEIGHLLSVLGGEKMADGSIGVGEQNRKLLDRALNYSQQNNIDKFIEEANPIMTDAQKMCVLVNLADSLLADGHAAPEEQNLFNFIMQGFGITEERFKPYFEVMMLKNDRSVFTNQNHPMNQTGYTVSLSTH